MTEHVDPVESLIKELKKLPGIGAKSDHVDAPGSRSLPTISTFPDAYSSQITTWPRLVETTCGFREGLSD